MEDRKQEVLQLLGQFDRMQQTVQTLQQAMQVLTPEERLVVQMLCICPEKRAADKLCRMLCVEHATVYRKRSRALEKLGKVIFSGECKDK